MSGVSNQTRWLVRRGTGRSIHRHTSIDVCGNLYELSLGSTEVKDTTRARPGQGDHQNPGQ